MLLFLVHFLEETNDWAQFLSTNHYMDLEKQFFFQFCVTGFC